MTIPEVSHDESIFPKSREFIPERWLDSPTTTDGIPLDRFMVSFGRGTRSCMGITYVFTFPMLAISVLFHFLVTTLYRWTRY